MLKYTLLILTFICTFSRVALGQEKSFTANNISIFNEADAIEKAKQKGLTGSELTGYVKFLRSDFSSKKSYNSKSSHTAYNNTSAQAQETVIYLEPGKPMSLGCPNMSFEQYNFNGWTGSTGTVSTGSSYPNYNQTGAVILNSAGDNASLLNSLNYHTIMSVAPSNPTYPNCVGYDSLACKAIGSQTVSQIPVISPNSFDGISVRMNGALANNRASRLKYITTVSSNNKRLSYSFALVFNDPNNSTPTHQPGESPYFKVTVRNENTNSIVPGCSSYSINASSTQVSDSLQASVIDLGDPIIYRKWKYYTVDLSSLAPGTVVSINFEVGGCTTGGHFGYAYVDAECGGLATTYANMCSGTNFATMVAPTGFSSYQWYNSSGVLIPGATNDTLVQTTSPGTTYSVNMVSPGGCVISQTVVVGLTTVNIINLNATSSCSGGNSGSATVLASGSNSVYSYSWTNMSSGSVVSNSQTALNLAPGNYSVLVSSSGCGQASANFAISVSPPFYYSEVKSFCGNAPILEKTGGTNYHWYYFNTPIAAPAGTNDTLFIDNASHNDFYTLVYKNSQGCKDSISYNLFQLQSGSVDFHALSHSCASDSSGSAVLNFNASNPPPYNYNIVGPTGLNTVYLNSGSNTTINLSNLQVGTYTAMVNDGVCYYNKTINISPLQSNFTLTPQTYTLICFPDTVTVGLDIGESIPTSCALSTATCNPLQKQLFTTGPFSQNTTTTYPTPFGNFYTNGRSQYLILKSDLNNAGITAGKLTSIAFNVLGLNNSSKKYPGFEIKMGCTNLNTLPNASTSSQSFISGLQTVYTSTNQTVNQGWEAYDFIQFYNWDGNTNIVIEVCFSFPNTGSGNFSENVSVELKQMPYIANMYRVEHSNPVCGSNQHANNGAGLPITNGINMLPNMRFGYCNIIDPSSYSVSISPNGSITANYFNDSITIAPNFTTPTGIVVYTITVVNPTFGCVDTKTITAYYPPLATSITATPINTTVCQNASLTLSSSGTIDYLWYENQTGSLVQIANTPSVNINPPVGTNTYVVIGNAPCPNSVADTKTVTVNVIPIVNLTVTAMPDVVKCLNKPFVLNPNIGSNNPANPATPITYSWTTLPANTPAPGNNNSSTYSVNQNTTTVFVVRANGVCANPISDTVQVSNFVNNLSVSISNSLITCPNTAITLNSVVNGGYPIYNYLWSINSSSVSNNQQLNYTSPASGGNYVVELSVIDSCEYQSTDTKALYVLPNTMSVSIIDSISFCGNTSFTLHATSSGGYAYNNFDWYFLPNTNNSLSNDTLFSYTTPEAEGIYTVQVSVSDSCGYIQTDYQSINVLPPCKIEIPNVITPNGDNRNEFFKIKNTEYFSTVSLTIFDRWGIKIYESNDYKNDWKADGLSDGTYFYVIDIVNDKKYSGFITVFK